ncbi:MAG: 3-oxoacyl-ACP reductase, partial [Flavobacterium sp.]
TIIMTGKFIQKDSLTEIIVINKIDSILLTSALVKKKKLIKFISIVFISSLSDVNISNLG